MNRLNAYFKNATDAFNNIKHAAKEKINQ